MRKYIKLFETEQSNNKLYNVLDLVKDYISTKIDVCVYDKTHEQFQQNEHPQTFFGIRFLIANGNMFRLNWEKNPILNIFDVVSVDVWFDGYPVENNDGTPNLHINVKKCNLVSMLSFLVKFLKVRRMVKFGQYKDENFYDNALELLNFMDDKNISIKTNSREYLVFESNLSVEQENEFALLKTKAKGKDKEHNMTIEEKKKYWYYMMVDKGFEDFADDTFNITNINSENNVSLEDQKRMEEFAKSFEKDVNISQKFKDLKVLIRQVSMMISNSLIISGTAGVGKTYTITSTLEGLGLERGKDWVLIKGKASPSGVYKEFYHAKNNKIIVFDDCDSVFKDEDGLNILKGALDSNQIREISWKSPFTFSTQGKTKEQIDKLILSGKTPDNFEVSSSAIFITNLEKEYILSEPKLQALLSRSLFMDMTFTQEEIIERIKEALPNINVFGMDNDDKQEVLDKMIDAQKTGLFKKSINFRTFENMCKSKNMVDLIKAEKILKGEKVDFDDDYWIEMAVRYS